VLVKEFPIVGESTVNSVEVPTVYNFVTVFNNSSHEITFLPDTDRESRFIHFAVSPFQYVTYPLDMMGTVASCKRSQTFSIKSMRRVVTPPFPIQFPNIRLLFSEENFNVNNYQQTNSLANVIIPSAIEPVRTSWSIADNSHANAFLRLTIPPLAGTVRVVTTFEVTCSANLSQPFTVDIMGIGGSWRTVFMAGEPAGTTKGVTGLLLRGDIGAGQSLIVSPAGAGVTTWASMHGYNLPV